MKSFLGCILLVVMLAACGGKQQYFEACPEIDIMKKADEAYFKGDWATLRSFYLDTCKVNNNVWTGGEISIDEFMENLKGGVANYTEYKQGETPYYEMIINGKGEKYAHSWQLWTGKHKNGKEVKSVVHITALFVDGKIGWMGVINDNSPFVAAEATPDSAVVEKVKAAGTK